MATSVAEPSLQQIARSLEPLIREHAEQGERERTIPPALVDALYERGVFRTFLPRELGGLEVDPVEWLDMVEELSHWDASVGWLAMINAGGTRLKPDVMRAILAAKGRWISASNLARTGIARRADGGYRVSGRWPFASGCPHSLFMSAQVVLHDDAGEVVRHPDDGVPWVISATWPIEQGQILDTWDGLGLRGTGSHDIAVEDLFVPEAYTNARPREPVYPGPLYKGSFLFMAHAAHAVGIARRAIAAFVELCGRPAAPGSRRQSSLGKTQMQQVAVAKADALVRAARAFAWEATARAYAAAVRDGEIPLELRVRMGQSMIFAVQAGKQAVDLVYEAAGASAVYRGTTLERCFRDIHTAAQHIIVTESRYDSIGQYELTKDHPDGPTIESVFPF